jgi:hypothetical protein
MASRDAVTMTMNKSPNIASNAVGTTLEDFYAILLQSHTKRTAPSVLAHWNGKEWSLTDRFPAWIDGGMALSQDGNLTLPHTDGKTLLRYSSHGVLESKLRLPDDIKDVDLAIDGEGRLVVVQPSFFNPLPATETTEYTDNDYIACMLNGTALEEFRFGTIRTLGAWTIAPSGDLWAFGYRVDETPVLFNWNDQFETVLAIPNGSDMLARSLLISKAGRLVLTIPYGEVYAGDLEEIIRDPQRLKRVGRMRPVTDYTYEATLNIRSICETSDGDIYFGSAEGLAWLRGNRFKQEFSEVVTRAEIAEISFRQPFVPTAGGLVMCRSNGVHIMRGDDDLILEPIDLTWFQKRGQSSKTTEIVRLSLNSCPHIAS